MKNFFLLLFVSTMAYANQDTSSQDLFEKTFARANSYCTFKDKRLELLIRGGSKFTETKELGYGEYTFFKIEELVEAFKFSRAQASLFRFYRDKNSICSKSTGYPIQGDVVAFLFGGENRPNFNQLVIQLYDFKEMKALEAIETHLSVSKTYQRPNGFIFKVMPERYDIEMGKVMLNKVDFTYQDRAFPIWMGYTTKGIKLLADVTFKKLPWRKYFKDQAQFFKISGWNPVQKKFDRPVVYFAVNFSIRKKCVLFLEKKMPLNGSETWTCHAM
jgi:hypothetical protein